jgi:hypothetical protein
MAALHGYEAEMLSYGFKVVRETRHLAGSAGSAVFN